MIMIGMIISNLVGLGFNPHPTKDDTFWRVVFLLPCVCIVFRVVSFLTFYRLESPYYY